MKVGRGIRGLLPAVAIAMSPALGCGDARDGEIRPSPVAPRVAGEPVSPTGLQPAGDPPKRGALRAAGLDLPFSGETGSSSPAFHVRQTGSGDAARFEAAGQASGHAIEVHVAGEAHAVRAVSRGLGRAIWGKVGNSDSRAPAVLGSTRGRGPAILGRGGWSGSAGLFEIREPSSFHDALRIENLGSGPTFTAVTSGEGSAGIFVSASTHVLQVTTDAGSREADGVFALAKGGGSAGVFRIENELNGEPVVFVESDRPAPSHTVAARSLGSGGAAAFRILRRRGRADALHVGSNRRGIVAKTTGVGKAARFAHTGTAGEVLWIEGSTDLLFRVRALEDSGDLAVFQVGSDPRIRFDHAGEGFFDGGIVTGGADLAESLEVGERDSDLEPGDVVAISSRWNRAVERSAGAYSTRVIGVYATRPGIVLGEPVDGPRGGRVPVAILGVVPTKVTAENGPIRRGDILVGSNRPGHAMRASDQRVRESRIPRGAILGKALQVFEGPGTGRILAIVNVN